MMLSNTLIVRRRGEAPERGVSAFLLARLALLGGRSLPFVSAGGEPRPTAPQQAAPTSSHTGT